MSARYSPTTGFLNGHPQNRQDNTPLADQGERLRYLRLITEKFPDAEIGVPYNNPEGMAMWRAPGVIGALMAIPR